MYTIVKCEGCTRIFAVSREQAYIICPTCGCSFRRDACTSYLDCEYRTVAVEIATRLDELIRDRSIPELTPEEMGRLRRDYQEFDQKYAEKRSVKEAEAEGEGETEAEGEAETEAEDLETDKKDAYGLFE